MSCHVEDLIAKITIYWALVGFKRSCQDSGIQEEPTLLLYVTGYWKTDHVHTFGQLLFIGPANSHTHTLSMHCCNTRLSCLACFSRADCADHVKSRLRQWDPWRALDGRYGSDIHPCVGETSHRPSRLVKAYD